MQNVQMPIWAAIVLALGIAFIGAAGAVGAQIVNAQKELRRLKITSTEAHATVIRQERKDVYVRLVHEINLYRRTVSDIRNDTRTIPNISRLVSTLGSLRTSFDDVGAEVMLMGSRSVVDQFVLFGLTIGPVLATLADYIVDPTQLDILDKKLNAFTESSNALLVSIRRELRIPYDK